MSACSPARPAGAALLYPLPLASLAVLVLNDHYLKRAHASFWTGKLSDFAGFLLAPLVLQAAFELASAWRSGQPPRAASANRALVLAILTTSIVFSLPELWPPAELAYRYGYAALQWPFRACLWLLREGRAPAFAPVVSTADPSDLLALPMSYVAYLVGRQR
jgi:hypothetical protein